jgi:hypothetical protein
MVAINIIAYHNHMWNLNGYGAERTKCHEDVQAKMTKYYTSKGDTAGLTAAQIAAQKALVGKLTLDSSKQVIAT